MSSSFRARFLTVAFYAAAMAWTEAALVVDLRTLIDRIEPYQPNPLPLAGNLARIEVIREAATLAMLAAVGALAGRTWLSRAGFAAAAFGLWDLLYYACLRVQCGWPRGLLDWDLLFLIPLPWWGPVAAPMTIAALMVAGGALWARDGELGAAVRPSGAALLAGAAGAALALYAFMADAIAATAAGLHASRQALPTRFAWPLFALAVALMAVPFAEPLARARLASSPRFVRRRVA